MALAKYYEEIEERWIANTSERSESALAELFEKFPAKSHVAGEVHLTRAGRRMEDIEVCEVGQSLDLSVVSTPGSAKPSIELKYGSTSKFIEPNAASKVKLRLSAPETARVHVSSHGFLKSYTIHVIEPFTAEDLPDFAELIRSLDENPPQWTEVSFAEFRRRLEAVLHRKALPSMFSDGIIEYHLGLFHEEQRFPSFRERLQSAYGSLRWFIPYSDVAGLICAYYLFCSNEFAASRNVSKGGGGRLRTANSFFLEQHGEEKNTKNSRPEKRAVLPLLVALPDLLSFQAIEAMESGRLQDADELVSVAASYTQANFDSERAARISFLRARVRSALGDDNGSKSIFESLQHCPWESIARATASYL